MKYYSRHKRQSKHWRPYNQRKIQSILNMALCIALGYLIGTWSQLRFNTCDHNEQLANTYIVENDFHSVLMNEVTNYPELHNSVYTTITPLIVPMVTESVSEISTHEYIMSPYDIIIDADRVDVISNATPEMIDIALEGTWLEGYGSLYYELEQEYGVNAFIAISNAILETGWDKSKSSLAMNHNNIYGMTNKSFDSMDDCIQYYFELIHNHYICEGYISLEEVNQKYCPPNNLWDDHIISIAEKLKNKVIATQQ